MPVRSTEFDSPHSLHARVAQAEEHRIRNAEVGVSNIPSGSSRCSSMGEQLHGRQPMSVRSAPLAPEFAGPVSIVGDAPDLYSGKVSSNLARGSTLCVSSTTGKSSAWFEHSIDNREAAGSTPASRTKFLRASEPVSCWPHKPCEWRSTRQPATRFQARKRSLVLDGASIPDLIVPRQFKYLNSGGEHRSWQHLT